MSQNRDQYTFRQADYILREEMFNLKGQIDLLRFGLFDEGNETEREAFLLFLSRQTDSLYAKLNSSILQRANKIQELNQQIYKDLTMARHLQESLGFQVTPNIDGLKVTQQVRPLLEVSGDFFDISRCAADRVRFFLADASGHGVQAALITMLIRQEYDLIKGRDEGPAQLLHELNARFKEKYEKLDIFVTGFLADLELETNRLNFASAGHIPQFTISNEGIRALKPSGKPLGIIDQIGYEEDHVYLRPGDSLFLYTDGLLEEFNSSGEEFGEEGLLTILKEYPSLRGQELLNRVFSAIDSHMAGQEVNDDQTALLIERL